MTDPKFYTTYKAVFDAIKTALAYVPAVPAHDEVPEVPARGVELLKTVVVGEQFTLGGLPKATVNPAPGPVESESMDGLLCVYVRGNITVVVRDYAPKDWFVDVILPMGAVVDALLADRTLGGVAADCRLTGFAPGEIKFKDAAGEDRLLFGGDIPFEAKILYEP